MNLDFKDMPVGLIIIAAIGIFFSVNGNETISRVQNLITNNILLVLIIGVLIFLIWDKSR